MKKITLGVLLFIGLAVSAQSTVDIEWTNGAGTNGTANATINVGDTVRWTWKNTAGHNLVPDTDEMDAPSDFGVTEVIAQLDFVYEYTFTEVAVIDYICQPHSGNMFGTITVIEELSVQDNFATNFDFYPNPVVDTMTIESLVDFDTYEVYDVLGSKVAQGTSNGSVTVLDLSSLNTGMYFVHVIAGDLQTSLKFMKK